MFTDPLTIIATLAVFAVLGILVLGIGTFAKGGENSAQKSNRLMQWRIWAQLGAVILILLAVAFGGQG